MSAVTEDKVVTVGATTPTDSLGKSIYSTYTREGFEKFKLNAIGASAISQAIKGVCSANGMLAQRGKYASLVPGFFSVELEGKEITGISFAVAIKPLGE